MYSGWESRLERLSQSPVSSLGSEAVTLRLSVGRRGSRPKAKVEDVEPRNPQTGMVDAVEPAEDNTGLSDNGERNPAPRGQRSWHATHHYNV
ncbi:hypothetical protein [Sporomusa silvacetica]|uniref:hypothetical protein n=1 Tax=Sporomusa silvacetica TaxID=55504 RepID=UPI001181BA1A